MSLHLVATLLFVSTVGCASSGAVPVRIEFAESGYLVGGTALASSAELQAYLRSRGIREVRLAPSATTPYARVEEAVSAIREVGASLGLVGSAAPTQ